MVIGLGYTMCVRFGPKCQGFVIAIATSSLHTSEEFSCVRQARTRRIAKKEQAEILQKKRVTKVLEFAHIDNSTFLHFTTN